MLILPPKLENRTVHWGTPHQGAKQCQVAWMKRTNVGRSSSDRRAPLLRRRRRKLSNKHRTVIYGTWGLEKAIRSPAFSRDIFHAANIEAPTVSPRPPPNGDEGETDSLSRKAISSFSQQLPGGNPTITDVSNTGRVSDTGRAAFTDERVGGIRNGASRSRAESLDHGSKRWTARLTARSTALDRTVASAPSPSQSQGQVACPQIHHFEAWKALEQRNSRVPRAHHLFAIARARQPLSDTTKKPGRQRGHWFELRCKHERFVRRALGWQTCFAPNSDPQLQIWGNILPSVFLTVMFR